MASPLLRPLSIGEILDGAFSVYRAKFTTIIGAALVLMIPGALLFFVNPVIGLLVFYLGSGLMLISSIWIVAEVVMGREVSIGGALSASLKILIPFIVAGILYAIGVSIGFVLLIIPGILLSFMWFAWMPIVIVEKQVMFFGRSRALAKGSWGKIFLVYLVSSILVMLPSMIVYGVAFGTDQFDSTTAQFPPLFQAIYALMSALTTPFSSAVVVLLYFDQRVRKEGLDVEMSTASLGESVA